MTLKVMVKVIFGRKILRSFHFPDQNYVFPFLKNRPILQMTLKVMVMVMVKVIFGRKIFRSFHLREQHYSFPF